MWRRKKSIVGRSGTSICYFDTRVLAISLSHLKMTCVVGRMDIHMRQRLSGHVVLREAIAEGQRITVLKDEIVLKQVPDFPRRIVG
ncbi:hypothetical protein BM1_01695 [Bipolaris maydis]|nr:hypothetical protein BM1_01695 [Bipolaris maydis]